jgi:hypothetical protein
MCHQYKDADRRLDCPASAPERPTTDVGRYLTLGVAPARRGSFV